MKSVLASYALSLAVFIGVATAGLANSPFVPNQSPASSPQMIDGVHKALVLLGILTIFSTVVFRHVKAGDGSNLSFPSGLIYFAV